MHLQLVKKIENRLSCKTCGENFFAIRLQFFSELTFLEEESLPA
jgi:hypothetical protein